MHDDDKVPATSSTVIRACVRPFVREPVAASMINYEAFPQTKLPFDSALCDPVEVCARVKEKFGSRWPSTMTTPATHTTQNNNRIETNRRLCHSVCAKQIADENRRCGDNNVILYSFFLSFTSGEFNCAQCHRSFNGLPITFSRERCYLCVAAKSQPIQPAIVAGILKFH